MEQKEAQLLIIVSSFALIALIVILISLFLYVQKKKVEFLLERKNQESKYQAELMKAQVEVGEQTLQNIGWELHDNIGQLLSVAKLKLGMVLHESNDTDDSGLADIKDIIGESLTEVRLLSKSLNREYLDDLGLNASIKAELDRFKKLRFFKINIDISGEEKEIDQKESLIIFRILQEHFSNIIKHAKASSLDVRIENNEVDLTIIVQDDGVGFDINEVKSGAGLFNMKSRAKLIEADFSIKSYPGKGTLLKIIYPIKKHHA